MKNSGNGTFYILAKYNYYSGTFNRRENGPVLDGDGSRLEFDSRKEAEEWIGDRTQGTYYLAHGEYSAPDYKVRKVPVVKSLTSYRDQPLGDSALTKTIFA